MYIYMYTHIKYLRKFHSPSNSTDSNFKFLRTDHPFISRFVNLRKQINRESIFFYVYFPYLPSLASSRVYRRVIIKKKGREKKSIYRILYKRLISRKAFVPHASHQLDAFASDCFHHHRRSRNDTIKR